MPLRMCTPLRDPPQPINEKPHRHALGQWTTRWRLKGGLWKKTVQMRVVLTTRTIPQTLIKPTMELYKIKTLLLLSHYVTEYFPCIVYFSATTSIFTCTCFVNTLKIACKSSFSCMFMFVHPCTSELYSFLPKYCGLKTKQYTLSTAELIGFVSIFAFVKIWMEIVMFWFSVH